MKWLKAKVFLLSIVAVWSALLFLTWRGWFQIVITILAWPIKALRRYRYSLWIAQDQDVNTMHNGNPDITVSSKVGYMAEQGSKTATAMAKVIDFLFYISIGQKNHCAVSIERDEVHY